MLIDVGDAGLRERLRNPHRYDDMLGLAIMLMPKDGHVLQGLGNGQIEACSALRIVVSGPADLHDLQQALVSRAIDWLRVSNGRVYLLKSHLDEPDIRELDWLSEQHRHAALLLQPRSYNDFFQRWDEPMFSCLFMDGFLTVEQRIAAATMRVLRKNRRGEAEALGSCFVLDTDEGVRRIVTARHVVANKSDSAWTARDNLLIELNSGEQIEAQAVPSTENDVALLESPGSDVSELSGLPKGASSFLELNDQTIICGYPLKLSGQASLSLGTVSRLEASFRGEDGLVQVASAAVNKGNSGGPVCDPEGNVVAVLTTRGLPNAKEQATLLNYCFAEPIERIDHFRDS